MDPLLPQNEEAADRKKRTEYLSDQRRAYEYKYDSAPFVLMKKVPKTEAFSGQYLSERALATAELIPNTLATNVKSFFDPLDDLQDYEDFFTVLPLPKVAKVYQTDSSFAEQRLSGANPLVIRILEKGDSRIQVLKRIASFQADFEPMFNLEKELEEGRIYVTDYTGTDENYRGPSNVQGGRFDKMGRKHLPKPLAFFWWRHTGMGNKGKLVPIAIQLDASKERENYVPSDSKVYTPFETNPLDWQFAKFCVQIADANHHEMSSHLCRTHFVMEPIAIATARQLAKNHPLSILLTPHFRFMLTNNELGEQRLINLGGVVDKILAGTLQESLEIAKVAYEAWNIKDFSFPTEINKRGMDKKDGEGNYLLTHYPYRDDGMLIWEAIHAFVTDYLNHFYPNSLDITNDTELQDWAKELAAPIANNGGAVNGMPTSFTNVEDLIEIVTTIIFICGPQHSAVNYSQEDYMAFVANMPLAAYRDIPHTNSNGEDESISEADILKLLPPFNQSALQVQTLFFLSAYRYDRLGYYDKSFQDLYDQNLEDVFTNDDGIKSPVIGIVRQFQQNLNMAELEIDERNRQRVVPYPYLKPSLILNSISI
jgi:arachidonate 15-lipoxygenase